MPVDGETLIGTRTRIAICCCKTRQGLGTDFGAGQSAAGESVWLTLCLGADTVAAAFRSLLSPALSESRRLGHCCHAVIAWHESPVCLAVYLAVARACCQAGALCTERTNEEMKQIAISNGDELFLRAKEKVCRTRLGEGKVSLCFSHLRSKANAAGETRRRVCDTQSAQCKNLAEAVVHTTKDICDYVCSYIYCMLLLHIGRARERQRERVGERY